MTNQLPSYQYPLRGLAMLAIFLSLGPVIQTVIGSALLYPWMQINDIVTDIVILCRKDIWPRLAASYSYYLPSIFLSGLLCASPPAKGEGLSLKSAILRTITMGLLIEIVYFLILWPYQKNNFTAIIQYFFFAFLQWSGTAILCWSIGTGFRLNQKIQP
ncbi:hypothetical protein [Bartonella sp. DGB2]|uniref:hypothetical protein n=1 Tax=Bartonella sp. DGB2 TaxID=3388426 RepID=UPI00398FF490